MPGSNADIGYRWKPIERLDAVGSSYDFSEIDSLQRQWLSIRRRREESNPQAYDAFLERLDRSWAIETGIIEGLYTLDRGVTETLVQRGFNSELIDRSATNKDPVELVSVLEDHRQAAKGVYGYIREGNPITKSFIRQLHVILTEHLPTYTAYDQFGNRFETALDRGGFKTLPNNPTRPDGRIHEYCPPVQVDSEIDNLVEWHAAHRTQGYHPLLIAAWLHHAFTQIHPFQDGNGRVARSLLTWHLVREGYLSVVVSRDNRIDYIDALEEADHGKLEVFVDFLVQLQKWTILEVLNEPEPDLDSASVEQIIGQVVAQVRERQTRMRSVNEVANILSNTAASKLEFWADQICQPVGEAGVLMERQVERVDRGFVGEQDYPEATRKLTQARYEVNRNESSFYVRLTITPAEHSQVPSFIFVISLHHVGAQLTGVMAASTFGEINHSTELNLQGPEEWSEYYFQEGVDPFTFTWQDNSELVVPRFITWVEKQFKGALSNWSRHISW